MNKRTAVAGAFLLWGVVSGLLFCFFDSELIMEAKAGPWWPLAEIVLVSSIFGQGPAHQFTGTPAIVAFWIGQLAFYGFLFYGICRYRPRKGKAAGTDGGNQDE